MELSCKNSGRKLNRWCLAWVLNTPPLNISDNTKILSHFSHSVTFDIETSHLFCRAKQMTGFCVKYNTELKCVKPQWCSPPIIRLLRTTSTINKVYHVRLLFIFPYVFKAAQGDTSPEKKTNHFGVNHFCYNQLVPLRYLVLFKNVHLQRTHHKT